MRTYVWMCMYESNMIIYLLQCICSKFFTMTDLAFVGFVAVHGWAINCKYMWKCTTAHVVNVKIRFYSQLSLNTCFHRANTDLCAAYGCSQQIHVTAKVPRGSRLVLVHFIYLNYWHKVRSGPEVDGYYSWSTIVIQSLDKLSLWMPELRFR